MWWFFRINWLKLLKRWIDVGWILKEPMDKGEEINFSEKIGYYKILSKSSKGQKLVKQIATYFLRSQKVSVDDRHLLNLNIYRKIQDKGKWCKLKTSFITNIFPNKRANEPLKRSGLSSVTLFQTSDQNNVRHPSAINRNDYRSL